MSIFSFKRFSGRCSVRMLHGLKSLYLSKSRNEWQSSEQHKMSLADILQINLKGANLLDKDITFFDWLRQCDYVCVRYDHSNDGNN
jgi:hypothetical protein